MKSQRMPVIVKTKEALDISLAEKMCVIYVGNELYLPQKETIDFTMRMCGYQKARKQGNNGLFFVRVGRNNGFNENIHEIYDPYAIL